MPILDGATYTTFVVKLSAAPTEPVSVDWKTVAVTALPDQDYQETSGTLLFLPTQTEKVVQVLVYGRAPGDTDDRTFRIALTPAPNVVLAQASADLVITAVDEEDAIVTAVTFAAGRNGLSSYEIAKLNGYAGTPAEWVEMQTAPAAAATAAAAAATTAAGAADTARVNAQAAADAGNALLGPMNDAKEQAEEVVEAGATIMAAKDEVLVAEANAKADAVAFRSSGIESGPGVETYVQLPEGRRRLLYAILDEVGRLLGGFDEDVNFLASGLRLLAGSKLLFNQHELSTGVGFDWPMQITDGDGNAFALMDRQRQWWFEKVRAVDGIVTSSLQAPDGNELVEFREVNWPWAVTDADGNAFMGIRENDVHLMHVGASKRLALLFDDQRNQARTSAIMSSPHNLPLCRLDKDRALLGMDGQSLSTAVESWPAITKTARRDDTFMIGQSVRAANNTASGGWTPQGGSAVLTPLIATVEPLSGTARVPMADVDVAAISPANSADYEGENAIVAITNGMARIHAERGGAPCKFIAASAGYGGTSIENLQMGTQKGQRLEDLLDLHKSLAVAASETWNVPAMNWVQGEENYKNNGSSGTATKAGMKAELTTFYGNLKTRLTNLGQTDQTAMFLGVTAGAYVNDAVEASISMAQVEFALETPGAYIVGPNYPYTDKGGHLDSNGSRWMGLMALKVMRRVLIDRLGHEPFYPTKIETEGRWIYVHMGGAIGPIGLRPNYTVSTGALYADGGFRPQDGGLFLGVEKTEAIGATILAIKTDAPFVPATTRLWYADRTVHIGNGNLCDSDPTRAEELYEYLPGTGMYAAANIPALVNNPYPLANWCAPFVLPVNYSR